MNDSLRTDVFLKYAPEKIGCACIFLAARQLKVIRVSYNILCTRMTCFDFIRFFVSTV